MHKRPKNEMENSLYSEPKEKSTKEIDDYEVHGIKP
jgi:hypothetical protein